MAVDAGTDVSRRIMRAATRLFFTKGFTLTSLREIAREAGTSESGVLRLYQSKDGLLRAVYVSCWAEINARCDEALAAARERDADPRNLLIELMRTVWETYHADPLMMGFINNHFGSSETGGLRADGAVDPDVDSQLREEYKRYVTRIHDLARAIVGKNPALTENGISAAALGHIFTSITYGIQSSWKMAQVERGIGVPGVTIDEALAAVRFLLYQEALSR